MRNHYDFSKYTNNPYARKLKRQATIRIDEDTIQMDQLSDELTRKYKIRIIVLFFISMLVLGVLAELPWHNHFLNDADKYLLFPVLATPAYAWCMYDRKNRGKVLNPFWGGWFIVFIPISLPVYLILEKGFKAGLILSLYAYGLLVAGLLCLTLSSVITNLLVQHV